MAHILIFIHWFVLVFTFGNVELVTIDNSKSNDFPIEELNGYTLREVFNSIIINPTFDNGGADWLLIGTGNVSNGIYTFITTQQYGDIRQVAPLSYQNDNLYIVSRFKASSNQVVLLSRSNTTNASYNQMLHSGSNNFEIKSMNWVNTTNQQARFSIVDNRVSGWSNIEVDYIYVANQTMLGISSLTLEQMNDWFNIYQENEQREINETYDYIENELTVNDLIYIVLFALLWGLTIKIVKGVM